MYRVQLRQTSLTLKGVSLMCSKVRFEKCLMLQAEVGARLQKQPPTLIWNAIWDRVLREKEPTLLSPSHYILLLPESQQGAAKPKLAARQL